MNLITPELLLKLAQAGASVEVRADGSFTMTAATKLSASEKRSERNRRYYERLKASESVLNSSETSESDAGKTPPLPLSPSLPLSPQTPLSPAHPLAPTPAHNARTREEAEKFSLEPPAETAKPKRKTPEPADDDAWLQGLASNPLYAGLNLRLELAKMQVWCETNRCLPSRRRFVNWINKAEQGLVAPSEPLTSQQKAISGWFGRREDEPWGADELALWRQILPIHPDDWQALEWFYTVATGDKRLCQSLRALLSKWRSEIDRAKNYNPDQK
jgi:hypothetical protein